MAGASASVALLHVPVAEAATETVVYSFCSGGGGCADGENSYAAPISVNGTLYGTTYSGGANGFGTVFALDPSTGAEKVLYSFCTKSGCSDGSYPRGGLVSINGTLYGTTLEGGSSSGGTVFKVDAKTGAEKVLHSFGGTDGESPYAGLIDVKARFTARRSLAALTASARRSKSIPRPARRRCYIPSATARTGLMSRRA